MFRNTAHVYDLVYSGKDYESEARAVRDLVLARHPGATSVLDVGCGTGRHMEHLREWFDVAGVDVDGGMLEVARQRLPGVPLVQGDMRAFDLGRSFGAVVCLFSSIGYLDGIEDLNRAVATMAAHLEPGGVVVIDGWVRPQDWKEPGTAFADCSIHGGIAVARASRSWREGRRSYLKMHHLVATLDGVEHLVDHHQLTLFAHQDYEEAFARTGLRVERVAGPMPHRDRYVGVNGAARGAG